MPNSDKKPDLFWHQLVTGDLVLWYMDGVSQASGVSLTNPSGLPIKVDPAAWRAVGMGDLNADRKPDLLWRHQVSGDLFVWFLDGTAFARGSYLTPSQSVDTNWQIRGVSDLNDDGHPDLLWHHQQTGELYAWFMDGTAVAGGSYLSPRRFADTNWQVVPR